MKDFFGQELAVGDEVAVEQPRYRNLIRAEIIAFTPQKIRVKYRYQNYDHTFLTLPNTLIKAPLA